MSLSSKRGRALECASQRGFSVLELMVVIAIIAIMLAIALPQFAANRDSIEPDNAANQFVDFLRLAQQRALSAREPTRLEVVRSTNDDQGRIRIVMDDDNEVVREEAVARLADVQIGQPSGIDPPAIPFNFLPVAIVNDQIALVCRSDGTITRVGSFVPLSGTVFFYPPSPSSADEPRDPALVRAITYFGPTGSVRLWRYTGSEFVPR